MPAKARHRTMDSNVSKHTRAGSGDPNPARNSRYIPRSSRRSRTCPAFYSFRVLFRGLRFDRAPRSGVRWGRGVIASTHTFKAADHRVDILPWNMSITLFAA